MLTMSELCALFPDIPQQMVRELRDWACCRRPVCGHFLRAVLLNDLQLVFAHRDSSWTISSLNQLVKLVYNYLPSACWGSREKMDAWEVSEAPACLS